jgi:hypothetical protein
LRADDVEKQFQHRAHREAEYYTADDGEGRNQLPNDTARDTGSTKTSANRTEAAATDKKGLTTPVVPLRRAPIKLELDHIQIVHCQKYRAYEDIQLTTSLTQFPTTGPSTLPERILMEFDFKTLTVMANR